MRWPDKTPSQYSKASCSRIKGTLSQSVKSVGPGPDLQISARLTALAGVFFFGIAFRKLGSRHQAHREDGQYI